MGLSYRARIALADYLIGHEQDIANETNDYGDLKDLFIELIGFSPRTDFSMELELDP